LFNSEKVPELTSSPYCDGEARDTDGAMKQRRPDYDDKGRGADESGLAPGDQVYISFTDLHLVQPDVAQHRTFHMLGKVKLEIYTNA